MTPLFLIKLFPHHTFKIWICGAIYRSSALFKVTLTVQQDKKHFTFKPSLFLHSAKFQESDPESKQRLSSHEWAPVITSLPPPPPPPKKKIHSTSESSCKRFPKIHAFIKTCVTLGCKYSVALKSHIWKHKELSLWKHAQHIYIHVQSLTRPCHAWAGGSTYTTYCMHIYLHV